MDLKGLFIVMRALICSAIVGDAPSSPEGREGTEAMSKEWSPEELLRGGERERKMALFECVVARVCVRRPILLIAFSAFRRIRWERVLDFLCACDA